MARALSNEVSNAYNVLDNELDSKQSTPRRTNELVATAKRLERMQARRRKLRGELRTLEGAIRHERKMLRALAGAIK